MKEKRTPSGLTPFTRRAPSWSRRSGAAGASRSTARVIGHREIYGKKTCPGRVVETGVTTARTALNIRLGAPTSAADRARTVAAGAPLPFVGWTSSGQSVHGNPHWYRDADDNYFWAGATDRPIRGWGRDRDNWSDEVLP
jgi:hypothetical protein